MWKPQPSAFGAPISSVIAPPISFWRLAYSAWIASSTSRRCSRVVCDQLANALRAAATAFSTSASDASEMRPDTASVAGLMTSAVLASAGATHWRSEEHTSELQSLMRISYAVFCLKKKNKSTSKEHQTLYHKELYYSA